MSSLTQHDKFMCLGSLATFIAFSTLVSRLVQAYFTNIAAGACIYDNWRWTTEIIIDVIANNMTANHIFVGLDSFCLDAFIITFLVIYFWRGSLATMYAAVLFYTARGLSIVISGQWPKMSPYLFFDPGFPSIFIPYDPTNDLYFSGHVGLATSLTLVCFHNGQKWMGYIGIVVACYTLVMLLSVGVHYTNDFVIGFVVGVDACMFVFANKYGYSLFVLKGVCYFFDAVASAIGKQPVAARIREDDALSEKLNSV